MRSTSAKMGSTKNKNLRPGGWSQQWDKLAAFGFGVTFFLVILVVSITLPTPTETQWFVFRVILGAAAAGFGAVVPGLIIVRIPGYIRAGGAIALFVLVYWFNPPKLISVPQAGRDQQSKQHAPAAVGSNIQTSSGPNSPNISSSGNGPVTVQVGTSAKARPERKKR